MGRLSDRRKAKKSKIKTPVNEPAPLTVEAKMAMALAFAGAGGVPALIAWAKTNERTRTAFYTLYAKTIPMTLLGEVHAKVEEGDLGAALERILINLLAQRREDEAGVIIDAQANSEPGVVDNVTYTRSTSAAHANVQNVVRLIPPDRPAPDRPAPEPARAEVTPEDRPKELTSAEARARAMAPNPQAPKQQSCTEAYLEWGGSSRMYWGPIGGGGPP
jgi:hypothetical protein